MKDVIRSASLAVFGGTETRSANANATTRCRAILAPKVYTTNCISISHKNLYSFDLHQIRCRPRRLAICTPSASESAIDAVDFRDRA